MHMKGRYTMKNVNKRKSNKSKQVQKQRRVHAGPGDGATAQSPCQDRILRRALDVVDGSIKSTPGGGTEGIGVAASALKPLMAEYRRTEGIKTNEEFFDALRHEARRQNARSRAHTLMYSGQYRAMIDSYRDAIRAGGGSDADAREIRMAFDRLAQQRFALPRLISMAEIRDLLRGSGGGGGQDEGTQAAMERTMRDLGWGEDLPIAVDDVEEAKLHCVPPAPKVGESIPPPCLWGRRVLVSLPAQCPEQMKTEAGREEFCRQVSHVLRSHMRAHRRRRAAYNRVVETAVAQTRMLPSGLTGNSAQDMKTCAKKYAILLQTCCDTDLYGNRRGVRRSVDRPKTKGGQQCRADATYTDILDTRLDRIDVVARAMAEQMSTMRTKSYNDAVATGDTSANDRRLPEIPVDDVARWLLVKLPKYSLAERATTEIVREFVVEHR